MALYRINYCETCEGCFYVEAENEKEAMREFEYQVSEGQIDFSDLEVVNTSMNAELESLVENGKKVL